MMRVDSQGFGVCFVGSLDEGRKGVESANREDREDCSVSLKPQCFRACSPFVGSRLLDSLGFVLVLAVEL